MPRNTRVLKAIKERVAEFKSGETFRSNKIPKSLNLNPKHFPDVITVANLLKGVDGVVCEGNGMWRKL